MLALGAYPAVSLKAARRRRDEARRQLEAGINPAEARRRQKQATQEAAENTFAALADEWLARQNLAPVTLQKKRWLLAHALPALGRRPIAEITPRELLNVLREVEATGKLESAHRVKQVCGQVFRYAILEEKTEIDPTASLRGTLAAPQVKHHAAISDSAGIGALLRAIDTYEGNPASCAALKLAPLVFVRPGELRKAEWAEFDLDAAEWRIPAERMKMKAMHLVPLSTQAVAILRDLHPLTGRGRYVFPSVRTDSRPMSENTITAALRRMGYTGAEMTGHGFRAMAASRLNEMGWNPDAIERQLAHAESNKVRAAYTHGAEYLAERRRMMQAWADYLDSLKAGGNVVALHGGNRA